MDVVQAHGMVYSLKENSWSPIMISHSLISKIELLPILAAVKQDLKDHRFLSSVRLYLVFFIPSVSMVVLSKLCSEGIVKIGC